MVEAVLWEAAAAYRATLTPDERAEVDRIIHLIELDPSIDGIHKVLIEYDGRAFTAYNNGRWHVGFSLLDGATVAITGIRKIERRPGYGLRL